MLPEDPICHKNCHKRATPDKGNGSDYYITFSSFFISFCTLAASTWLYMFIVMLMSLCPMIICKTLISRPASAHLVQNVCLSICGCVKYRTKKFYFFMPKTIWRFHQVVPAPLLSSDKSFLSCSSYLCSEKISSKFHSISISSWIRETAAPVTAISPTLQFIQVSHKRIQIKFRCALFHVHVWKTNHHTWHYSVNRHNALSCRII